MSKLIIVLAIYFTAHTHTRTLSDTHIDNRCVRWNGRASTIVFTCKCKRFPPFHFLPPLLALTPSPSNIYMQIDRTLVPLPFSRCHSERKRHTQKEISTKRQMLQYYRALALSASVPWVAAANAGGFATVRQTSLPRCVILPLLLPAIAIAGADFLSALLRAQVAKKSLKSQKLLQLATWSWHFTLTSRRSRVREAHTHMHARTHTHR